MMHSMLDNVDINGSIDPVAMATSTAITGDEVDLKDARSAVMVVRRGAGAGDADVQLHGGNTSGFTVDAQNVATASTSRLGYVTLGAGETATLEVKDADLTRYVKAYIHGDDVVNSSPVSVTILSGRKETITNP